MKGIMSSSSFLLHQMLLVFLLFCLSKASGGTCLSYGHSCWGGHGKRNGAGGHMGPSSQRRTSGWYLSKLLDPPAGDSKNMEDILKNQNLELEEMENFRRNGYQLYPESDTEKNIIRREKGNLEFDNKHNNKWESETDESEEEIMVLTPEVQRVPVSKFHLYEIMNPENMKPRKEY